jgi:hypothetical protein
LGWWTVSLPGYPAEVLRWEEGAGPVEEFGELFSHVAASKGADVASTGDHYGNPVRKLLAMKPKHFPRLTLCSIPDG